MSQRSQVKSCPRNQMKSRPPSRVAVFVSLDAQKRSAAHPAGAGGGSGSGTWFVIGLIVRRYANTDFKSSSVRFRYTDQGMGGRIGLDTPQCRPLRMVLMKMSSVQMPIPVILSGVRFAV